MFVQLFSTAETDFIHSVHQVGQRRKTQQIFMAFLSFAKSFENNAFFL